LLLISTSFDSHPHPHAVWTESKVGENASVYVFQKQAGERQGFRLQPHSRLFYNGVTVLLTSQGPESCQKWKFVPYYEDGVVCPKTIKIYCGEKLDYNLTIRDDTIVFARSDREDPYQVIELI
jgi:hypothetical protein